MIEELPTTKDCKTAKFFVSENNMSKKKKKSYLINS